MSNILLLISWENLDTTEIERYGANKKDTTERITVKTISPVKKSI